MEMINDLTLSDLEIIFNILEKIFIIIGVPVGSIWIIWKYFKLQLPNKAKAELQLIQLQLETQPIVKIKIRANQIKVQEKDKYLLEIYVELNNIGSKNTLLSLEQAPLKIYKISFDENDQCLYGEEKSIPYKMTNNETMTSLQLRAKAEWNLNYLVMLREKGFYNLVFRVPVNDKGIVEAKDDRFDIGWIRGPWWIGQKTIEIK